MASHDNLDDEDDFGGDFSGGNSLRRLDNKRSFGDLEEDEDDIFGSKKKDDFGGDFLGGNAPSCSGSSKLLSNRVQAHTIPHTPFYSLHNVMPSTTPTATTSTLKPHTTISPPFKTEPKTISLINHPSSSSSKALMRIDGSEEDLTLSKSKFLTRVEVIKRRSRRVKQLARIYRDHYWTLMEELKLKYRKYYWEFGKSPFQEDEELDRANWSRGDCTSVAAKIAYGNSNIGSSGLNNGNSSRCGVHGCKAKAMTMTRFCHMHILSDAKQKLYKACNFSIKSSTTGPILCGKPILRSTVPSYCSLHFQKAEKHMARALKKAGLNVTSTSKLAPKFHVIVAEYVRQIQNKRRSAQKAHPENVEVKEDNNS